eukprot:9659495-Ditylum_brightwellii.AAC.1
MVSLDLCGDKAGWGHQGWGESGSGLCKCILNKPGIVMLSDVDCIRPHAYMNRHKAVKKIFTKKPAMCFSNYFS